MVGVEQTNHHVRVLCAQSVVLLLSQAFFEGLDVPFRLAFVLDPLCFYLLLHLFVLFSIVVSSLKGTSANFLVLGEFKVDRLLSLRVVGDKHLPAFDVVKGFVFVRCEVSFYNS